VHYNGGASAAMAMVVPEAVFHARELTEKKKMGRGGEWRRREREWRTG
jgi:hypothetical protein